MTDTASTRSRRALLAAGALSPLAAAASPIEGSGRVVDDERRLASFTRIVLDGPLDVRVTAAASDLVVVHADENIAPLIETAAQGGALTIGVRAGAAYRTRTRVQVRVQARQVQGVVLRGSGKVRVDRVDADVFEATVQGSGDVVVDALRARVAAVSLAGSGDVRAAGTVGSLGVVVDGSGDVYCADLLAQQVAVRIRGNGDVRVNAVEELQVDIDGSGDVRYRGQPKVHRTVRGSGTVEPLR